MSLKEFVFLAALAVLMAVLATACGSAGPEEVEIAVSLRDKQLAPRTIRVGQGDTVTLKIESDAQGSLHLHGYDIEQEVTPGEVTDFVFVADAAGRYRIAFHSAVSGGHGQMSQGSSSHDSGGSHREMSHDALASETPISVAVTAEPDDMGGVNVQIMAEGWRWAPEEVNLTNSPSAGHAHVYVDGAKINRVYDPHYYLMGLELGMREIRVTLNANYHNELTYSDQPVEATTMVTIDGHGGMGHQAPSVVNTEAAMSVEIMAHPDPLGGYNLQVMPAGFEFNPQNVDGDHVPGEGIGYVSIDGKTHARLYTPWFKLPDLEPGMHEIIVSLANNQGQPYQWQGSPVQASVTVHAESNEQSEESGHHDPSDDDGEMDSVMEQDGDGAETPAAEAAYDVGYLEVHPK